MKRGGTEKTGIEKKKFLHMSDSNLTTKRKLLIFTQWETTKIELFLIFFGCPPTKVFFDLNFERIGQPFLFEYVTQGSDSYCAI